MAQKNRIIVLDTETTGMNQDGGSVALGHRVVEIGAVEIINRQLTGNHFHVYLKPDRLIDPEAFKVHGITDQFLSDKQVYAEIHQQFINFINGAEFIAHNAPFDVAFINQEFSLFNQLERQSQPQSPLIEVATLCQITDSLALARAKYPGKKNSLDALCQRFEIDLSKRVLHGALLDAELLAEVYLKLTGGQRNFDFNNEPDPADLFNGNGVPLSRKTATTVIYADEQELLAHEQRLDEITKEAESVIWRA